jgi:hypothetical protein
MKLTKRKGFNFFRSYYDVYNELDDKNKLLFMEALLDRQFLGIKPEGLTGMAKFAYISQTNSIDSQVKGFEDKTGLILNPTEPPTHGYNLPPRQQVEEKEKVEEKGKWISQKFSYDDYFESKEKAFEEIRDNQKYIEEDCVMILSGRGWKAVTPVDVIGLLKNFLNGKAKLENPKAEVRQHFKNWIGSGQTKLENLITLADIFKKSLNG